MLKHGDRVKIVNEASPSFGLEGMIYWKLNYIIIVEIQNRHIAFQPYELEKIN